MSYQNFGAETLNYYPCRYGTSKLLFRGPKKDLAGGYVAVLGGTETYGKFVETPYTELFEAQTGITTVNLGCVNAGIDVFLQDDTVLGLCSRAQATVIQIAGANNLSNRFYSVHPRRNDRFLAASALLKTIYANVDFTDFNFTRHMLSALQKEGEERFAMVRRELQDAWVGRMGKLIQSIKSKVILLWMSDHSPDDTSTFALEGDPVFVTRDMLEAIRPQVSEIIEIVATPEQKTQGLEMMRFPDLDRPAALEMLGPLVHSTVADELSAVYQVVR